MHAQTDRIETRMRAVVAHEATLPPCKMAEQELVNTPPARHHDGKGMVGQASSALSTSPNTDYGGELSEIARLQHLASCHSITFTGEVREIKSLSSCFFVFYMFLHLTPGLAFRGAHSISPRN